MRLSLTAPPATRAPARDAMAVPTRHDLAAAIRAEAGLLVPGALVGVLAVVVGGFYARSSAGSNAYGKAATAAVLATATMALLPVARLRAPARPTLGHALAVVVAGASFAAATIHLAVVWMHAMEAWQKAAFFAGLGAVQLAFGLVVVRRPFPLLLRAGVVISLGTVVTWLVSRTTGLPLPGILGEREDVGLADTLSSALELGVAAACVAMLRAGVSERRASLRTVAATTWIVVLVGAPLVALGLLSAAGGLWASA